MFDIIHHDFKPWDALAVGDGERSEGDTLSSRSRSHFEAAGVDAVDSQQGRGYGGFHLERWQECQDFKISTIREWCCCLVGFHVCLFSLPSVT